MLTSAQIAEQLNGELQGSKYLTITTLCEPLIAGKHCVSLVVDKNILKQLSAVKADLLVVSEFLATTQTQIKVKDPKQALITLLKIFFPDQPEFPRQISDRAYIAHSAVIGKNVTIMPFAYIGEEVVIGDNSIIYPQVFVGRSATIGCDCILYPNVTVYHQCRLGNRVIIHSGTVIGADGFGYYPQNNAPAQKIPQKGIVVIEDDVEVGANTAIDRAVMSQTVIHQGVKIDNLVHLAHNVCIGENTLIAGQVGVAGSTRIGKNNLFGGQVGVSDHVTIGDNNIMLGKCLVSKNLKDGNIVQGTPARDHRENLQREALISKLLRNQK